MEELLLVEVPTDSRDYYINNIGCLRYIQYKDKTETSSCVAPNESGYYLENGTYKIIGCSNHNDKKFAIIKTH